MLAAGQRLSRFELVALLGRGGMGEVWRARDLRLDREVALKVLPEQLASDPERVARFEREARVLAALNHPHVAQLFELGEAHDDDTATLGAPPPAAVRFLVMELVEGETLAERLARGPVALAETLDLARQVGEGLLAAHGRGVIHRDLKPANIMITPEGQAKILDFGLARFRPARAPERARDITDTLSDPGVVIGTAAYMAPEQVRGEECDERCDVWAFACCVAETLTGARVFVGATLPELVGKVLAGDADLTRLPAGLPRMVRSLLERSLRTEREDRPSLADVVRALRAAAAPRVASARPRVWRAAVTLAVALALAALLGRSLLRSGPAAPRGEPALRLAVGLEPIQAASGSAVPSGLLRDLDGALLRAVSDRKSLAVVSGQAAEVTVRGTVAHEALGLGVRLAVTDEHAGTVLGVVDLPIDAQAPAEAGKQVANAAASLLELEQVAREVGRGDALHGFLARRTRSVEAARGFRDGLRLLERTRYAEAKDALQRGLAADPAFWPAHLYLALDAKATSRFDEAHREVAEAQRLAPHPDEAEAVVIEEMAATVAEDSQRRREALERARRFFPESAELTFGLAQVYRFQDRPAEAIPLLEKLLAMGWRPDWSPTREELAFCQLLAGRLKEVLATASAGEERFPTRYRYPFYAACALQQLGRTDQAREALRQAIRKHLDFTGTPPLAVHQLAAYWASLLRWEEECRSQWDAVLAETESGLLERPGSAALLQARAEALVGLGRYRDARNVLAPLVGAPGADPGVYLALCHALVGLGDAEGARKALAGAAAGWREGSVPALGTLAYNIAAGWAAAGDNARALDWLLRARDQYGVDRLDLAMDPDLDPLRRAGLLARLPPRR